MGYQDVAAQQQAKSLENIYLYQSLAPLVLLLNSFVRTGKEVGQKITWDPRKIDLMILPTDKGEIIVRDLDDDLLAKLKGYAKLVVKFYGNYVTVPNASDPVKALNSIYEQKLTEKLITKVFPNVDKRPSARTLALSSFSLSVIELAQAITKKYGRLRFYYKRAGEVRAMVRMDEQIGVGCAKLTKQLGTYVDQGVVSQSLGWVDSIFTSEDPKTAIDQSAKFNRAVYDQQIAQRKLLIEQDRATEEKKQALDQMKKKRSTFKNSR